MGHAHSVQWGGHLLHSMLGGVVQLGEGGLVGIAPRLELLRQLGDIEATLPQIECEVVELCIPELHVACHMQVNMAAST